MWLILSPPKASFIYFGLCAQKQMLAFGTDLDAQALSKNAPALLWQNNFQFISRMNLKNRNESPVPSRFVCAVFFFFFQHNMG